MAHSITQVQRLPDARLASPTVRRVRIQPIVVGAPLLCYDAAEVTN
jgi:hypothetical protein